MKCFQLYKNLADSRGGIVQNQAPQVDFCHPVVLMGLQFLTKVGAIFQTMFKFT